MKQVKFRTMRGLSCDRACERKTECAAADGCFSDLLDISHVTPCKVFVKLASGSSGDLFLFFCLMSLGAGRLFAIIIPVDRHNCAAIFSKAPPQH